MGVSVAELQVADRPGAWAAAGFVVGDDDTCRVGTLRIRLLGPEVAVDGRRGIVGWGLAGWRATAEDVDGIPTTAVGPDHATAPGAPYHPNGVTHVDHVVLASPDLERTVAALAAIGLEPRRERDGQLGGRGVRQVFYRPEAGPILELVGTPGTASAEPSRLWGITHVVADIDASAAFLGERTGPVKDAVQPGRRITTLRTRELDMSVRTALITPHVRAPDGHRR